MSVSSAKRLELLARLNTQQIQYLLSVLLKTTMLETHFVKTAYADQARNFVETLQFLKTIDWVKEKQDQLALSNTGMTAAATSQDDREIRKRIGDVMISEISPYRKDVADYLLRFRLQGSSLAYRPSLSERLQRSPLRNFLMDIHVVSYRAADDTYVLEEDATDLYVWAINFRRFAFKTTPQDTSRRKEELGLAAETAVLQYEIERLGKRWAHRIEHISERSPFACYDIKSVTLSGGKDVPRYIEVKAVPIDSYQFYWSTSEVEVAQLLRNKYFLYLLPADAGHGFDLSQMLVIEDPYIAIYKNTEAWRIEDNVIVCSRKKQ